MNGPDVWEKARETEVSFRLDLKLVFKLSVVIFGLSELTTPKPKLKGNYLGIDAGKVFKSFFFWNY